MDALYLTGPSLAWEEQVMAYRRESLAKDAPRTAWAGWMPPQHAQWLAVPEQGGQLRPAWCPPPPCCASAGRMSAWWAW